MGMSEGLSFGGARARGVAVVCAGLALIAWSVGHGFRHVLPTLAPNRYGPAWWGHFGAFLLLFLQFVCSYVAAIRTDPGTHGSPELLRLLAEARARGLLPEIAGKEGKEEGGEGGGDVLRPADRGGWLLHAAAPYAWRRCPHSGLPKPPRAHFCRHSQRLVLEMDHHCVWIFGTVGWGTYGAFYRAVLWFVVGSAFGCAEAHSAHGMLLSQQQEGVRELWLLRFVLLAALAVVLPFLGWHTYLSCTAQTSIEYKGRQIRREADPDAVQGASPYCRGGWWVNFRHRVCGGGSVSSLLVPWSAPLWPPTGCLGPPGAENDESRKRM